MTNFAARMIGALKQQFQFGTPVVVRGKSRTGRKIFTTSQVAGTVIDWRHETTGASYSQNGDPNTLSADGKLLVLRLLLRKVDGEVSDLVIDDLTTIAQLVAV